MSKHKQKLFPMPLFPFSSNHSLFTAILFALVWSGLAFCGEIHEAAKRGDLAKVEALLKDNPNLVSSKDNNVPIIDGSINQTPLHYAASQGRKAVAAFLLASKADVNAETSNGARPLHYAASRGFKDIAELLLAHGADVNAKGFKEATPLHYAAAYGYRDTVKLLLASKAEVDAKNKYGATPLHLAAGNGYKDVVELLLADKADINAMDREGMTPLHEAVACGKVGCKDVVELLLAAKADINAKGKIYGWTPWHCAALHGQKDMVELLLAHKADANTKDVDGNTPLHLAAAYCDKGDCKDVVEFLRKNGGHE